MGFKYEDDMSRAFAAYLDIRKNIEPATEVKKRARDVGIQLIIIFGDAAPTANEIRAKVKSLGYAVKIRHAIKGKRGKKGKALSRKQQIKMELGRRIAARKFTATGWFVAVKALGGNPKLKGGGNPGGIIRGELINQLSGLNPTAILINDQPGAKHTAELAGGAMQKAFETVTEDMMKYVRRKLYEAAKKNGLAK